MRLLLDACVWGGATRALEAAGHDVIWAGEWQSDPGDDEILARAYEDGRVLVTLDKDFGELAVALGRPHRGIVRLVHFRAREQAQALLRILAAHQVDLEHRAILTAEPGRVRIRSQEPSS